MRLNKNRIQQIEPRVRLIESFTNIRQDEEYNENVFVKPFLNKHKSDDYTKFEAFDLNAKELSKSGLQS